MAGPIYEFGPFQLDAGARRLTRDGAPQAVSARHVDVLVALVARAGTVVSKDALVDIAWREVAVTDNSLEQAVSALRRTLGPLPGGDPYIQTVPRQGYRFVADVRTPSPRASDAELEALIAPHRAWVEGRAALESLAADRIAGARAAFERVLEASPDDAIAHIGIANACVMQFETTRATSEPDVASLAMAAGHAREACRRDPRSGEAWATSGFILDRTGHGAEAVAALGRAVSLEPDNWRHHFRLALVSWGEARLRAARRTLALLPGLPLAHWLAATVHVARQNLNEAEDELRAGIESMQATPRGDAVKFPGVALEWLLGSHRAVARRRGGGPRVLRARAGARGPEPSLRAGVLRERVVCVGAVHLRRGRSRGRGARVPPGARSGAAPPGRRRAGGVGPRARRWQRRATRPAPVGNVVDLALAEAIGLAVAGSHAGAAAVVAAPWPAPSRAARAGGSRWSRCSP